MTLRQRCDREAERHRKSQSHQQSLWGRFDYYYCKVLWLQENSSIILYQKYVEEEELKIAIPCNIPLLSKDCLFTISKSLQ